MNGVKGAILGFGVGGLLVFVVDLYLSYDVKRIPRIYQHQIHPPRLI